MTFKRCRYCLVKLTDEMKETEKQRINRLIKGLKKVVTYASSTKLREYARNYVGRSKVHTYQCVKCGRITSLKPHNHNWLFMEDIQWQKK